MGDVRGWVKTHDGRWARDSKTRMSQEYYTRMEYDSPGYWEGLRDGRNSYPMKRWQPRGYYDGYEDGENEN